MVSSVLDHGHGRGSYASVLAGVVVTGVRTASEKRTSQNMRHSQTDIILESPLQMIECYLDGCRRIFSCSCRGHVATSSSKSFYMVDAGSDLSQ